MSELAAMTYTGQSVALGAVLCPPGAFDFASRLCGILPEWAVHRKMSAMEKFLRVVGRRVAPPAGALPSAETRAAMTQMAHYLTRAPKGVFHYASHEEANRDREQWQLAAILAKKLHG
jgi:hypothetical protein